MQKSDPPKGELTDGTRFPPCFHSYFRLYDIFYIALSPSAFLSLEKNGWLGAKASG
jgi:hypothetical protein